MYALGCRFGERFNDDEDDMMNEQWILITIIKRIPKIVYRSY